VQFSMRILRMYVGLSNILDREVSKEVLGRAPMERTHREIIGTGLVSSELLTKVGEGVKVVGVVEAFLIFPVAALDLAVVPGCIGPNQLMAYAQSSGGGFKERLGFAL
jgi:hypothetical protein